MKYLVTGGTGFIGRQFIAHAEKRGHQVEVWTRTQLALPPLGSLEGVDAVVHLAGEPVAQRWNDAVKTRIRDSRVLGTRALADAIARAPHKPRVLVCASAIGIYGDRGDEVLTETSAPGSGFLADVCREWESEAGRAANFGVRVVKLRIGFVLGNGGGALAQMVPAFRLFVGGRLGSGRQWMPWVHLEDVLALLVHAAETEAVSGVWNATSPNPVRNVDFTAELAHAVHRPALLPVPPFALKLAFGEMGQHMLDSARVVPAAAVHAGFQFQYPELKAALRNLLP